jgi:hypothetical protein
LEPCELAPPKTRREPSSDAAARRSQDGLLGPPLWRVYESSALLISQGNSTIRHLLDFSKLSASIVRFSKSAGERRYPPGRKKTVCHDG